MKSMVRSLSVVLVLGLALLLAACGGRESSTEGSGGGRTGTAGDGVTIDLASDGEMLAFDKTTLTVEAGQVVTLNFQNTSIAQQHNWVLVDGGEDVSRPIAEAGILAGLQGEYLPADRSKIIAHTGVLNGRESGSVTFTAPAPGTYLYICTVPGHYPIMQGTLIVQ
ncbi:plastocyanin/azurin family copper-binding protein [Candidatus Chloroploca asiatica]|uniref:Auracyanin n=1 Tax=Candidatus Chloroploca asiatica TaxID=1506545 RepID=A0A2H3L6Q2_9CHLR|nr:plastocyanin/azurin family copper-binding protein [Candidatus Chloroploca asiatica]PDV98906.1 auracyanin [Candidatus Chloroploca asiatica]